MDASDRRHGSLTITDQHSMHYPTVLADSLIELLQFLTNLSHMDSHALCTFGSDLKASFLEATKT